MVGDFTTFFDKIDHYLLKKQLSNVLNVNRLSDDWYNVYRSITKYGYYIKKDLIEQLKTDGLFREKNNGYFKSVKEFRKFNDNTRVLGMRISMEFLKEVPLVQCLLMCMQ